MDTKHGASDLPVESLFAYVVDVDTLIDAGILDVRVLNDDYDPIKDLPNPVKTEELVITSIPAISQEELQTFLEKIG